MEKEDFEWPNSNPDIIPEYQQESIIHPKPEVLLLRMAIGKVLNDAQKEIWYMYAYDRMKPSEIARKLHTSRSNVSQRIKTIERQLTKWCQERKEVYEALKEAEIHSNDL